MMRARGKIIFSPTVSAEELSPIVRRFADIGYMGEGMTTTLSNGLYSVIIKADSVDTIRRDMEDVCKGYNDRIEHMSVTSIYTHGKGATLNEFLQSFREDYNGRY